MLQGIQYPINTIPSGYIFGNLFVFDESQELVPLSSKITDF